MVVHPVVHSCSSSGFFIGGQVAGGNLPVAHEVEAEQARAGLA